jgi:hypothetical protein
MRADPIRGERNGIRHVWRMLAFVPGLREDRCCAGSPSRAGRFQGMRGIRERACGAIVSVRRIARAEQQCREGRGPKQRAMGSAQERQAEGHGHMARPHEGIQRNPQGTDKRRNRQPTRFPTGPSTEALSPLAFTVPIGLYWASIGLRQHGLWSEAGAG